MALQRRGFINHGSTLLVWVLRVLGLGGGSVNASGVLSLNVFFTEDALLTPR